MSRLRMFHRTVPFIVLIIVAAGPSGSAVSAQEAIRLFDGTSLAGWVTSDGKPADAIWEVTDGMLHRKPNQERGVQLLSAEEFGDFDLQFEWKLSAGANSGVKYRVRKYGKQDLGCEYQIIDDREVSDENPEGSTGSLYELYPPNLSAKVLAPLGEFNHSRIIVSNSHVEHWLNGRKIVDAWIGSSDWFQRVAASKFNKVENFALNERGRIMLQDHGGEIWFRNITLRPLPPPILLAGSMADGRPAAVGRATCRHQILLRPWRRLAAHRVCR